MITTKDPGNVNGYIVRNITQGVFMGIQPVGQKVDPNKQAIQQTEQTRQAREARANADRKATERRADQADVAARETRDQQAAQAEKEASSERNSQQVDTQA
jgi:hypothetical protein